jgi:outer membrane biosynthesis protein TonB
MPQIEGGKIILEEYIAQYPYPTCGLVANIEGVVVIQFIVEKDGSISGTQVIRSPDPCLSKAALDYFNKLSGWKPGKFNEEIVACFYTLPIEYNLSEYKSRLKKEK